MTPRSHARTRRAVAALLLAVAGTISMAGCDPRAILYFFNPSDPMIPPPKASPSLKGKRVVVLTHSVAGSAEFLSLDRDMAREFVTILREKVKKIDVVDPSKVWTWVEGHQSWSDPAEAAKAFEADMAIFLEVEQFQLQNPGDLNVLQGDAKTHIQAVELVHPTNSQGKPILDQPKEARMVYDQYQDTVFPKSGHIPYDSGTSRDSFKRKFLQVVTAECSWHFVPHSPDDTVQDVKYNNK